MKTKFFQLVEYKKPWQHWELHEALEEDGVVYWVGSKAIRKYAEYHHAIEAWAIKEPMSSVMDIMSFEDAVPLFDKVDYSTEEELNFDV